ncbi:glycosyltransferase family 4 protein [Oleiharenicola lentus]|uniref:glycosyltransferase family 4 protein n=1 Tax=Oleiharenicola lentus TaxID=2508720 RepID=UPI003F66CF2C
MPRLLIAFPQCAHDPVSGAARSTRIIGEWLASAGWEVHCVTAAFCENRRWLTQTNLAALIGHSPPEDQNGWVKFNDHGVQHRALVSARSNRASLDEPAIAQLGRGVRRALESLRPDIVLTYGDDTLWRELRSEARAHGARVVYAVHNAAHEPAMFSSALAILAPSQWLAHHYAAKGVENIHALPPPIDVAETIAESPERIFTAFVNPSPEKGRAVFLGILRELSARNSQVPLLVIEGRAGAADLVAAGRRAGLDLRTLSNLMISPAVPQPRDIFRVTRTLLVPSLHEAAGRVVAEAQLNGVPCLVSNRGGLPETCGDGGRIFPISTAVTLDAPIADENVIAWADEIERLATDEEHYAAASEKSRAAGERFTRSALLPHYEAWFARLLTRAPL